MQHRRGTSRAGRQQRQRRRGGPPNRTRRRRSDGRNRSAPGFYVQDNANGWHSTDAAIGAINNEVGISVGSHDQETSARLQTIDEAERWNALLAVWPISWAAKWFGFRPWHYSPPRSNRSRRRFGRRKRHRH